MCLNVIWRILFVRCYRYILLILIMSFAAFGEEYELVSLEKGEKSTGDIVEFSIDNISLSKVRSLKNTRVNKLLYILDSYEKNDTIIIEAIISELKQNEKLDESEDTYKIVGLNYKYSDIKLGQDFAIVDNKISLAKSKLLYVIFCLLLILIIFIVVRCYLKKKKNKEDQLKRKKRLNINVMQLNRNHFEFIYRERNELFDLYEVDKKYFKKFEEELNKIQYKKEWTEEEFTSVKNQYEGFSKNMREKNGI